MDTADKLPARMVKCLANGRVGVLMFGAKRWKTFGDDGKPGCGHVDTNAEVRAPAMPAMGGFDDHAASTQARAVGFEFRDLVANQVGQRSTRLHIAKGDLEWGFHASGSSNSRTTRPAGLVRRLHRQRTMEIAELMKRNVATITPESSLTAAAELLKRWDVGFLVVVDQGIPCGVVTDRDIVVRGVAGGAAPDQVRIEQIMSPELITCRPDDDTDEALRLMRLHCLHRLPVVTSAGKLVGIVSLSDLVNCASVSAEEFTATAAELA